MDRFGTYTNPRTGALYLGYPPTAGQDRTVNLVGTTPIPTPRTGGINVRTPGRTLTKQERPLQPVSTPNTLYNMIGDFSIWNLVILGVLVYIAFRLLKIKGI